jgi:hypothetical protein
MEFRNESDILRHCTREICQMQASEFLIAGRRILA